MKDKCGYMMTKKTFCMYFISFGVYKNKDNKILNTKRDYKIINILKR